METWTLVSRADGIETYRVSGREAKPLGKKLNPIWWFQNEAEPSAPEWYLPGGRLRTLRWYLRNPLQNFGNYVAGVCDRDYEVHGPAPVFATTLGEADPPRTGWKWSVIRLGVLRLPFASYESARWIIYAGWQAGGFFGFKLNVKASPVQVA